MTVAHKPVWQMTDEELLKALQKRSDEINVALAFGFLVRMFTTAENSRPNMAAGLLGAAELTKLYGRSFAPGHPEHPFKDFDANASVQSLLEAVERKTPAHKPIPPIPVHHGKPMGVTRGAFVYKGDGRSRSRPESKVGMISAVILDRMNAPDKIFTVNDVRKVCDFAVNKQDVANAIAALKTKDKVVSAGWGFYRVISVTPSSPIAEEVVPNAPSF